MQSIKGHSSLDTCQECPCMSLLTAMSCQADNGLSREARLLQVPSPCWQCYSQRSICLLCRLGNGARLAAKGWGLELLCKDPRWRSDALTVIETPKVSSTNFCWCQLPQAAHVVHVQAVAANHCICGTACHNDYATAC